VTSADEFGYLFVHHVEDPDGHGEQVFFSLSDGDDPRFWRRLNGGAPVLRPTLGTGGVRDPFLVRGDGEFFVLATDLRIYGGDDRGWDAWTRHGARSIVVWRSVDLLTWSDPWLLEVAPPEAGMAWAPEASFDPGSGEFTLVWSSALYDTADDEHAGDSYSRVLTARTRDFRSVEGVEVLIDRGVAVIDTTVHRLPGAVLRVSKDDSRLPGSRKLFAEVDTGDGFRVVAERIADDLYADVEAPVLVHDAASTRSGVGGTRCRPGSSTSPRTPSTAGSSRCGRGSSSGSRPGSALSCPEPLHPRRGRPGRRGRWSTRAGRSGRCRRGAAARDR
jgi:hypothetical protein